MATISQDYIRLTMWALGRILSTEGSIPPELQLTGSLLSEHESLVSQLDRNHSLPQPLRLSASRVACHNVSGSGDSFGSWDVIVEEDEPTSPAEISESHLRDVVGSHLSAGQPQEHGRQFSPLPNGPCEERKIIGVTRAVAQSPVGALGHQVNGKGIMIGEGKCVYRGGQFVDIVAMLGALFTDEDRYQRFVECQRSNIQVQSLIDVFQLLLDVPSLETDLRNKLLSTARWLARSTDFHPTCFNVQNVDLAVSHPLAGGSFANIYKGIFMGQHICMKVIRLYQPPQVNYFLQHLYPDTILWGQLKHENVLRFYGVFKLDSQLCLITPWAENGDIKSFLNINPHVDRVRLSLDIAYGIAYLHKNDVIHGDLKGANILVHSSGRALVSDFGLSSVTDSQILKWMSRSSTNSKGGTIRWQAPELYCMGRAESVSQSKASDVYALGCVLYEIFTGEVPFCEYRLDCTVMHKVCMGEKPSRPASPGRPWSEWGLTDSIWALMEDCWTTDPVARPTIEQFIERLDREMMGVDNRPANSANGGMASHLQFKQNMGYEHIGCPTIDELETLLWATNNLAFYSD